MTIIAATARICAAAIDAASMAGPAFSFKPTVSPPSTGKRDARGVLKRDRVNEHPHCQRKCPHIADGAKVGVKCGNSESLEPALIADRKLVGVQSPGLAGLSNKCRNIPAAVFSGTFKLLLDFRRQHTGREIDLAQ